MEKGRLPLGASLAWMFWPSGLVWRGVEAAVVFLVEKPSTLPPAEVSMYLLVSSCLRGFVTEDWPPFDA